MSSPSTSATGAVESHSLLRLGILLLAYVGAHKLAYMFLDATGAFAAIWPAVGIAMATLLLNPRRWWPAILALLGLINLLANLLVGKSFLISMEFTVTNLFEAGLGAWAIYRWCGAGVKFTRVSEVLVLIGVATFINALVGFAGVGAITLTSNEPFWMFFKTWWIGNGLGLLLVTPLVVTWATSWRPEFVRHWRQCGEALLLLAIWSSVAWLIFSGTGARMLVAPQPYVLFALIAWGALRFGSHGTTLLLAALAIIAFCFALTKAGVFPMGGQSPTEHLLMIQMYLSVLGVTGLLLAASRTERISIEQSLRFSEERFRSAMEHSGSGMAIVAPDGRWIAVNAALCRIVGHAREELLITDFQSLTYPEDLDADMEQVRQMLNREIETYQMEKRYYHKDGHIVWVQLNVSLVWDAAGPLHFISQIHDITQRKQAEEHVREQARLLDLAHDAILVRDLDDNVLYWNKSAERIYGWTAQEALGQKVHELLSKDLVGYAAAKKLVIEEGDWKGELTIRTKTGQEMTIEARWTLVCDHRGIPKSILAINTDITERKKLEAQLLRSQRMESVGTLAGGIAHDLNNVLTPLLICVQLLKEKVTGPEEQKLLTALETNVLRGANLVKQVLAFGRGVKGERIVIQPARIAREIKGIVQETFPKSVAFELTVPGNIWTVTGDFTQLHQVLLNLCVNARDAMPGGGQLSVQMENLVLDEIHAGMNPETKPGSYVAITVTDTGTGIPPEIQDRIFEPFFTTKESGKGTGLGLPTTLGIVKSHGGFINFHSEAGRGSAFTVHLPANTAPAAEDNPPAEQSRLPRGNNELVLVVDDEEPIRTVARKTLEHFGYRVLLAVNGAEAVSLYSSRRQEIAVVITDMAMPVMDGPAAVAALKAINPKIKVIGSSGVASNSGVARAIDAGIQYFIPKPYTADVLLHTLHKSLHGNPAA